MKWSASAIVMMLSVASTHFSKIEAAWIDEDTPLDKRTTTSLIDGTEYELVMSDEFNVPNRTFADGDDPAWTAIDKSDDDSSAAGGGSLHFYNSSMITTTDDGLLEIRSIIQDTEWNHFDPVKRKYKHVKKHFTSGMLQSWNKFCFTGGIIEVDVIFPGDPFIGGLWPAVWLLGNLGRATYEGSTNNIWPWSYDTCNRKKQQAQTISACNAQNHYGLNPFQGRGATEIDLIEIMTGDASDGPLPATVPGVSYPYADLTLQVAPGVEQNRPQSGSQPIRNKTVTDSGFVQFQANSWYEGLEVNGNTTLNPYFYGTYLGETKPEEPVHRNKHQVFQADAVGAMHQMTPANFKSLHTIRLEWQPGPGGRLDWFLKDHRINETFSISGDGLGQDWVRAFSIKDEVLNLTGAQIPIEPSYIIMNTGISSTWGFPYDVPDDCVQCYDCTNVTCACNFHPGFCNMMKESRVAMYIDYVRVYQTKNHSAHVGEPHTVGCDPVDYPTKEYIKGHEYLYMRPAPFGYDDDYPLKKKIKRGGGKCQSTSDCGGERQGICLEAEYPQGFLNGAVTEKRCKCDILYTGPYCLSLNKKDDSKGAWELSTNLRVFANLPKPALPITLTITVVLMLLGMFVVMIVHVKRKKREIRALLRGEYQMVPSDGRLS